jgi:ribonuclease BN (tRNA processing enzyme)
VYEDENVTVRAILVLHPPTFPSFAYRFDSADGSIVFSGDTTVSQNLIKLARGADILVHEVIDREWVESRFEPPMDSFEQAAVNHLLSSHTTIEQVGEVAERAGVGTLVLNHLVPADNPVGRWLEAKRGFSGRLVVGEDLMQLGLGEPRRAG